MDSTEIRQCSALWYAWGQIDSGIHPHMNLEHGFQFQREQEALARDYHQERRSFLPSVLSAWAEFVERTKRPKVDLVKAPVPAGWDKA